MACSLHPGVLGMSSQRGRSVDPQPVYVYNVLQSGSTESSDFLALIMARLISRHCANQKVVLSVLAVSFALAGVAAPQKRANGAGPLVTSKSCIGFEQAFVLAEAAQSLAGSSVVSDFDGDRKIDFAVGRWDGKKYAIEVQLSASGRNRTLSASSNLSGIRLLALDLNKDGYPDIIISGPIEPRPLAVWLGDGKGGFIAVDCAEFQVESESAETQHFENAGNEIWPDLLLGFRQPACPPSVIGFSRPEARLALSHLYAIPARCGDGSDLSPRSPPANSPV